MPTIVNLTKLTTKLQKLKEAVEREGNVTVQVGYTQNYAIWVHEVPANHSPGKQDKYLEQPARQLRPEFGRIIREILLKTGSLEKGLITAGLRLQRASQELVPIDTGALKASAYTALERDAPSAAAAAYAGSVSIAQREQNRRKKQKIKSKKQKAALIKKWNQDYNERNKK